MGKNGSGKDVRQVKRQDPTQSRATESMVHGLKHWTVLASWKNWRTVQELYFSLTVSLAETGSPLGKQETAILNGAATTPSQGFE